MHTFLAKYLSLRVTVLKFDIKLMIDDDCTTWPRGYPQLSTKFILLMNVKMPTIVGILTFISMINTTSERLKARNFFICQYFSFYEQLKFLAQLS